MGRLRFEEIAKTKYKDNRNLVISRVYETDGSLKGYAVSSQLIANAGGRQEERVFLKGGIGIIDAAGLVAIGDAIAYACNSEKLI